MDEPKILVVALLLVVIFLGIASFLLFIERRVASAERKLKELEDKENSSTVDQ